MPIERIKTVSYITDLTYELQKMAKASNCNLLALLLEMAVEEGRMLIRASQAQTAYPSRRAKSIRINCQKINSKLNSKGNQTIGMADNSARDI